MPYGRYKSISGRLSYTYGEKYGYSRTDSVVREGRIVMIGSNQGIVTSVGEHVSEVSYATGGYSIVLNSVIRGMREITSRDSF